MGESHQKVDVQAAMAAFQERLKKLDLKLTSQRKTIFRRILGEHKHFSAEQLFEALKAETNSISKATVYRTLQLLVDARLVDQVDFDRGFKLYERNVGQHHHDHLICVDCGKVIEFHNEELEALQESIVISHEFEMISHTHKIYGVCSPCQRKRG